MSDHTKAPDPTTWQSSLSLCGTVKNGNDTPGQLGHESVMEYSMCGGLSRWHGSETISWQGTYSTYYVLASCTLCLTHPDSSQSPPQVMQVT